MRHHEHNSKSTQRRYSVKPQYDKKEEEEGGEEEEEEEEEKKKKEKSKAMNKLIE